MILPPFVELGSRLMLIMNWQPDLTSEHILVLRPATAEEITWLDEVREDAYAEIYARLFGFDELRGRLAGANFEDE